MQTKNSKQNNELLALPWWRTKHLAQFLDTKQSTIRYWRHKKLGPPYTLFSPRSVRYTPELVLNWLAQNERKVGA